MWEGGYCTHYPTLPQIYTNHRAKVHKKQQLMTPWYIIPIAKPKFTKKQQLMTPTLRFPLHAGGTE